MEFYRDYKEVIKKYIELSEREFKNLYKGEGFICNNGQYGFYTEYIPDELAGIYEVKSSCACNFDKYGTRLEGYVILTQNQYKKLIEASDRIESEGSLY